VIKAMITSGTVFDQIEVTGSATLTGSTLALSTKTGYSPPEGQTFTIVTCSIACTGSFSKITDKELREGAIYIVSNTGTAVTLTVMFPTITSVTPGQLPQGATKSSLVIDGSNFLTPAKVTISGTGVKATVVSTTSGVITASVTVGATAALGVRNVTVSDRGGSVICKGCLTITAATTSVSAIPSTVAAGATVASTPRLAQLRTEPTIITSKTVTVSSPNSQPDRTGKVTDRRRTRVWRRR
jgi:hypothetical protein